MVRVFKPDIIVLLERGRRADANRTARGRLPPRPKARGGRGRSHRLRQRAGVIANGCPGKEPFILIERRPTGGGSVFRPAHCRYLSIRGTLIAGAYAIHRYLSDDICSIFWPHPWDIRWSAMSICICPSDRKSCRVTIIMSTALISTGRLTWPGIF